MNIKRIIYLLFLFSFFLYHCKQKSGLEIGIEQLKKGEYLKAVKSLRSALMKDSLNPQTHYNLCLAYVRLDSTEQAFKHYLKLNELGSGLCDDARLKELLANLLDIEPYPSSLIKLKRMNQFKGVFSPDGQLLAIAAARFDRADIYLIKLDGTFVKRITRSGMNTDPAFSPDGKSVVFVSDVDGDDELYLYNIKTGRITKLTDNRADDFSPDFAPDGKEIVYVSNLDDPYKWEIYKLELKTKKIKRLTNNNYWDGFPKFTADGRSIIFSSKRDGSEDIYKMKTNGTGEKVIYAGKGDDNDPILTNNILYFKSNVDGDWDVYKLNLKTKILIKLTHNRLPDWNPRISRDGTKLLIARKLKRRWRLFFINIQNPVPAGVIVAAIQEKVKKD